MKKGGLIPLRHMSDEFIQDPKDHVQIQQTVYAQVIEKSEQDSRQLSKQDQKITMTSKASAIQYDQADLTLSLFKDLEKVRKATASNVDYNLGDVVNCVVQEVTEFGLDTLVEGHEDLRGLCPMSGLQDVELPSKGQTVAGVIVFVDYRFGVVELSIQPDIIRKAIKKVKKRPKEGNSVKAVCVLKR